MKFLNFEFNSSTLQHQSHCHNLSSESVRQYTSEYCHMWSDRLTVDNKQLFVLLKRYYLKLLIPKIL